MVSYRPAKLLLLSRCTIRGVEPDRQDHVTAAVECPVDEAAKSFVFYAGDRAVVSVMSGDNPQRSFHLLEAIALGWIGFARDEHETILLSMLTGHGRATPLPFRALHSPARYVSARFPSSLAPEAPLLQGRP